MSRECIKKDKISCRTPSRLIIKNLPSYVTPEKLKAHLSQRDGPGGTLTDLKVARKSDGTSRRFAFVGYKTEEEAKKVAEWFNRTFIDSTRITVQVIEKGAKDAPRPRPNKRPRMEGIPGTKGDQIKKQIKSSASKDSESETKSKSKRELELEEFMQVMQPRTKKERTWMNEDITVSEQLTQPVAGPSKKLADELSTTSETEEKQNEEVPEELDDLEWMKRRMKKTLDDVEEKSFIQDDDVDVSGVLDSTTASAKNNESEIPASDNENNEILRTGRLFIRNLSYSCTQSDLEVLFSSHGTVKQVHMPLDPNTKATKGLAFVTFSDPSCALKAFEELDKTSFQGRLLHILPAAEQKGSGVRGVEEIETAGKKTLKSEREKKRKESSNKEFNWSMLYMNADAVASSIADRMNIQKADILNPDSDDGDSTSAAVKLALAETHIIQETKSYLESEGIDLSAFSSLDSNDRALRARRSDTCILVKNIPYGTTASQIADLFSPHGELSRVLVPPAGTIAVVEYVHPDEAAKGFRSVAYRRMGSSIIYLEKAPIGIFNGTAKKVEVPPSTKPMTALSDQDTERTVTSGEVEVAPGSTLYIKNLSFATTSERLTSVFSHLPSFAFARVQTKPDPKRPGARLSMGFGFVGFTSPDAAKSALKGVQGFVLDGHTLSAKFAGRGTEEDSENRISSSSKAASGSKSKSTTKMIVKNVPFEVTKKELRSLFGAHGQLKSVRLPKKFDSRARGFAFLDFATRHEAENAYTALRHTHLLGRHLVLEWADDEASQDIDMLRKKAGVGYGDGSELPGRKRKLQLGDDDDDDMGDD